MSDKSLAEQMKALLEERPPYYSPDELNAWIDEAQQVLEVLSGRQSLVESVIESARGAAFKWSPTSREMLREDLAALDDYLKVKDVP